jgi:hypothetical protein
MALLNCASDREKICKKCLFNMDEFGEVRRIEIWLEHWYYYHLDDVDVGHCHASVASIGHRPGPNKRQHHSGITPERRIYTFIQIVGRVLHASRSS